MASAVTATTIDKGLKVYYGGQMVEKVLLGAEDRVFLNTIKKTRFNGKSYPVPVYHGRAAGGVSHTFANALTNTSSFEIGEFDPGATLSEHHSILTISTEALARASGDKGSFLKTQTMKVDEVLNQLADALEYELFGDGDTNLSQIATSSTLTDGTFLVSTIDEAKKYQKGMVLKVSQAKGGAVRAGSATVTHVDVLAATPKITTDGGDLTSNSWAAADYVYVEGNAPNGGAVKGVYGLAKWASSPSASFLGQDQTVNPSALSMLTYTGSQNDIAKSIIDSSAFVKNINGGKPNRSFVNHLDFARLVDQMRADVKRDPGGRTSAGFSFITVHGAAGPVQIIPSAYCPEGTCYVLDWSSWELIHLNSLPIRLYNDDGALARRQTSDSGIEIRADGWHQLSCCRPGDNVQIDISGT